jgi:hypothetical protein
MNAFVALTLLALPFLLVGALITVLIISIGSRSGGGK